MTPTPRTEDYQILDTSLVTVLQCQTFDGAPIIDCKVIPVSYEAEPSLEKCLADGWKLLQIAWTRDDSGGYGHAPTVRHVLKAVIIKIKKIT